MSEVPVPPISVSLPSVAAPLPPLIVSLPPRPLITFAVVLPLSVSAPVLLPVRFSTSVAMLSPS